MVLDALTPESEPARVRWRRLLTRNGIDPDDGEVIYELRCRAVIALRVPIFCPNLVERIVAGTPEQAWDTSLIDITIEL